MLRKHDDGAGKRIQTHHKHSAIMPSGGIRCAGKPVPSHVKARSIVRKRLCNTAERAFPQVRKARSALPFSLFCGAKEPLRCFGTGFPA